MPERFVVRGRDVNRRRLSADILVPRRRSAVFRRTLNVQDMDGRYNFRHNRLRHVHSQDDSHRLIRGGFMRNIQAFRDALSIRRLAFRVKPSSMRMNRGAVAHRLRERQDVRIREPSRKVHAGQLLRRGNEPRFFPRIPANEGKEDFIRRTN